MKGPFFGHSYSGTVVVGAAGNRQLWWFLSRVPNAGASPLPPSLSYPGPSFSCSCSCLLCGKPVIYLTDIHISIIIVDMDRLNLRSDHHQNLLWWHWVLGIADIGYCRWFCCAIAMALEPDWAIFMSHYTVLVTQPISQMSGKIDSRDMVTYETYDIFCDWWHMTHMTWWHMMPWDACSARMSRPQLGPIPRLLNTSFYTNLIIFITIIVDIITITRDGYIWVMTYVTCDIWCHDALRYLVSCPACWTLPFIPTSLSASLWL